jgi:hypothetical protein
MHVSKNWTAYKVLKNGPDAVSFELEYAPWDAGGRKVWETKRITLEAGSNLNRIESTIHSEQPGELTVAIGIVARAGTDGRFWQQRDAGVFSYWEPAHPEHGHIGCGVIVDPSHIVDIRHTAGHYVALVRAQPGKPLVYHAGAGWSKSGDFADAQEWEQYLTEFAARIRQ